MPIATSRQAVHSIYHSIHIYDGFRLMNPVHIIIHNHSVFKYHISIPYSLSYFLYKDILNLCTYFIYSFTYSFHILIHVLVSYTHSCTRFIYSFMYSFHILIHVLNSYTHSCTHFIYSFTYSFHILIHVLMITSIHIAFPIYFLFHACGMWHFIYLYVLFVLYQTVLSPVGV